MKNEFYKHQYVHNFKSLTFKKQKRHVVTCMLPAILAKIVLKNCTFKSEII